MIKIEKEETQKYIFTDTFKTKDLIWEAYNGYIEHYNQFVMLKSLNRIDGINIAGLTRYANYFYTETKDFYNDFEKELGKEEIEAIEIIMKKRNIGYEDYPTLREFFSKFMKESGIKNIIRDVDDINKTVLENR